MAQLKDIVEREQQRGSIAEARTIHLFPEGSFLRAYNWSAWLWCSHIGDFKPTHRTVKSLEQPIIHIGCPKSSFISHMPVDVEPKYEPDGSVHVDLPDTMLPSDSDPQMMLAEYEQWKQMFPVQEGSKRRSDTVPDTLAADAPQSISAVVQRVLAFPVESKSLIECVSFLSEIKQQLARLM